ncbi:MAG: helix-turn-helix domain-containing protein, partial [Clostridiales bacterium]|nr:helix-turn-helix domain-containing protein [Clostridiales bacterium]
MTIGNRIREARKKQGMTQEELAGKMFVTPQAVSQWERDLTIPSADKLTVLAATLHTSVNALAGDAEEVPDWTMLDSLFSAEHMYSRMTTLADTEHLTETRTALRFMRKAHDGQTRKPAFYSRARVPYIFHPLLMA